MGTSNHHLALISLSLHAELMDDPKASFSFGAEVAISEVTILFVR